MALTNKLTALGDAIREQTGKTELLTLDAMVTEIKNISFSKTTPINVVPSTNSTFTYDGTSKTPVWQNFDSEQLTISGATSSTNAGTHKVYFTPKAGYTWADESVESREVSWTIARKSVNVPTVSGSLTYNKSSQSPTWSGYNTSQMTIGGTTSGTNAGSYSATFTPNSNHKWSDGSTTAKSVTWTIGKATGTLSLSATSGSILDMKGTKTTFTANYNGDAAISAASSNTGVATVSVSGKTVTVTSVANGSATITVSVGSSTNYTTPSNATYSVTVEIRLYLYKLGDKCTSNGTGSWTAAEKWHSYDYYYQTHSGDPLTPTITWNSDNVVINCGNGQGYRSGIFYKNAKINLADYSKITFDGLLNIKSVSLYAWSSIGNLYDSEHVVAKKDITNTSRSSVTLSLSSISTSNYIGFGLYGNSGSNAKATMYNLYLS